MAAPENPPGGAGTRYHGATPTDRTRPRDAAEPWRRVVDIAWAKHISIANLLVGRGVRGDVALRRYAPEMAPRRSSPSAASGRRVTSAPPDDRTAFSPRIPRRPC